MALPNFLIVGAAKSGTTSMYEYLAQHPQIFMPVCKEPHYFSRAPHPQIAKNDLEYEKLFSQAGKAIAIGEASVTYLQDPEAPERIKRLLDDVKILIFLRNPIMRAYSAWWHMVQLGFEKLSFGQALEAEAGRMASEDFIQNSPMHPTFYFYRENGFYSKQVEHYFSIFKKVNIKIFIFEEMIHQLEKTCSEIFAFLGVDQDFTPSFEVHNAAQSGRATGLHKTLASPPALLKNTFDRLPMKIKMWAYQLLKSLYWLNTKKSERPSMNKDIRKSLVEEYEPDIRRLEKLIDHDLSIWKKEKNR